MKKILLTLWIMWLVFCWVSFAADAAKVFDWCASISNYKDEKWYSKLEKQLTDKWIWISSISEICYSKSRSQVTINIPTIKTEYKKCDNSYWEWTWSISYCRWPLNIFSYNIKNEKLSKAKLDSNTIYDWFSKNPPKNKVVIWNWYEYWNSYSNSVIDLVVNWFWKRIWDYIVLNAGYGDMWCYSSYNFRYYYKTNIIKAESAERWCVEWAVEWDSSWYTTIINYINKTTKKIKAK